MIQTAHKHPLKLAIAISLVAHGMLLRSSDNPVLTVGEGGETLVWVAPEPSAEPQRVRLARRGEPFQKSRSSPAKRAAGHASTAGTLAGVGEDPYFRHLYDTISRERPRIPDTLLLDESARLELEFSIAPSGRILAIHIARESSVPDFDVQVVAALKHIDSFESCPRACFEAIWRKGLADHIADRARAIDVISVGDPLKSNSRSSIGLFLLMVVSHFLVACSGSRLPKSTQNPTSEEILETARPIYIKALPFEDSRAPTATSAGALMKLDRIASTVRVALESRDIADNSVAQTMWRWRGILRAAKTMELSGTTEILSAPRCSAWLVRVEGTLRGARQVVAWTQEGVRTFVEENAKRIAPFTPALSSFALEVRERDLKLKVGDGTFEFSNAGLSSPATGDLTAQLMIDKKSGCPKEDLVARFGPLQVKAR